MWNIKMTSKRQATFPARVCAALTFDRKLGRQAGVELMRETRRS